MPDSISAFHELIDLSSIVLKKIMKMIVGIILVKRIFVGKGKATSRNTLRKNSSMRNIGTIIAQNMP